MSTSSELKEREIAQRDRAERIKAETANKDRSQKERSEKRKALVDMYGHTSKGIGSLIKGGFNDPSWYKNIPGMTNISASIPDFQVNHVASNLRYGKSVLPAVVQINYGPTIGMDISYLSGQQSNDASYRSSAFNRALNRVCTQLEMRNSRVLTYARDVVGRYIFIVSDVASNILRLKAAIDVYDLADAVFPYVSKDLISALGFAYEDFKSNIAAYKEFYMSIAYEFNNSLPLPGDLSYVKRTLWMGSTILKDGKSNYASYIVFNRCVSFRFPDAVVVEDRIGTDNYISDKLPPLGFEFLTFTNMLRSTISKLVNGNTWRPLIRDIRGGTKGSTWVAFDTDVTHKTINVLDSHEVMNQIHNLTVIPYVGTLTGVTPAGLLWKSFSVGGTTGEAVVQGLQMGEAQLGASTNNPWLEGSAINNVAPGSVVFRATSTSVGAYKAYLLNDEEQVIIDKLAASNDGKGTTIYNQFEEYSSDSSLVGTRLHCVYGVARQDIPSTVDAQIHLSGESRDITVNTEATTPFLTLQPIIYGTEVVCGIKLFGTMSSDNVRNDIVTVYGNEEISLTDQAVISTKYIHVSLGLNMNYVSNIGWATTIDWMPTIAYTGANAANGAVFHLTRFGELDHFTTLDLALLSKLHEMCIESELSLPDSTYLEPLK